MENNSLSAVLTEINNIFNLIEIENNNGTSKNDEIVEYLETDLVQLTFKIAMLLKIPEISTIKMMNEALNKLDKITFNTIINDKWIIKLVKN